MIIAQSRQERGKAGVSRVKVRCNECGWEDVLACDYVRAGRDGWSPNVGQVRKKLVATGWQVTKRAEKCPSCAAAILAAKAEKKGCEMTKDNVAEIRKPSREQKREIARLLDEVYDTSAGRYVGAETDKTVADTLGGGVMSGWVADIREEFYGPDGGNDDLEGLLSDIADWRKRADASAEEAHGLITKMTAALRDFNAAREEVDKLSVRLDAIKAAIGPRVARA